MRSQPGESSRLCIAADLYSPDIGIPFGEEIRVALKVEEAYLDGSPVEFKSEKGEEYVWEEIGSWDIDDTEKFVFVCQNDLPSTVSKSNLKIKWKILAAMPSELTQTYTQHTPVGGDVFHPVYVTYDAPIYYDLAEGVNDEAKNPWKQVLENACAYAHGKSNPPDILTSLTEESFKYNGHVYDPDPHNSMYCIFYLRRFLDYESTNNRDLKRYYYDPATETVNSTWFAGANCCDMANYLHVMGRALGVEIKTIRLSNSGGFKTKYILPTEGENCTVEIGGEVVAKDWQQAFVEFDGGGNIIYSPVNLDGIPMGSGILAISQVWLL